jgi:hypothetical protein
MVLILSITRIDCTVQMGQATHINFWPIKELGV